MFESSRSYFLKTDHIIVPMFRGTNSRKALKISYDMAKVSGSEITAITIRERKENVDAYGRLNLVTAAHNEGKKSGIKVVPKIQTFDDAKQGIIMETSGHYYDLLFLSTRKRSLLSSSIFGNIGDYIMKNSKIPTAILSSGELDRSYNNILIPLAESINTRAAVFLAMQIGKIYNSHITIYDLRKYDRAPSHGFRMLMDNPGMLSENKLDITIIKSGDHRGIKEEIGGYIESEHPDCVFVGTRKSQNYRMTSDIKLLIKDPDIDTILVKK
jgi:nucleotide-binding universal stress UspA family protein